MIMVVILLGLYLMIAWITSAVPRRKSLGLGRHAITASSMSPPRAGRRRRATGIGSQK